MKEKIKAQKGFIQIPLLIGIIATIIILASTGAVLYKLEKSDSLTSDISEAFKVTEDIIVSQKENLESAELRQTEQPIEETVPTPQIKEELQQKTITIEEVKDKKLLTDDIAITAIKEYLEAKGLIDVRIQIADKQNEGGVKTLTLGYKSSAYQGVDKFSPYSNYTAGARLVEEMGKIMFVFTNTIDLGWDVDEFEVFFGDITTGGTAMGMWYCNRVWIDDYLGKRMSIDDLNSAVKGTMTFF